MSARDAVDAQIKAGCAREGGGSPPQRHSRVSESETPSPAPAFDFAGFRLDAERGLWRAGRPVHLPQKELRGLILLVSRGGAIVTRDEYVHAVWPGGEASEDSIARSIYLLRRALGKRPGTEIVETVYGAGFRIASPVHAAPAMPTKLVTGISPAAFETFQIARELRSRQAPADLAAAIRAFEYAAELEPGYAAAWAAIADCHIVRAIRSHISPIAAGHLACAAAERALAIDPEEAGAWAARGWVRGVIAQRPHEGLADLDRAIGLDPCDWLARFQRAWLLPALGEYREALREVRFAAELTPLHPVPRALEGWLLFCSGRAADALEFLRAAAAGQQGPSDEVLRALVLVAAWSGHSDEAVALARRVTVSGSIARGYTTVLAYALACAGDRIEARRLALEWSERPEECPPLTHVAAVHLALGEADRAAAALALARERCCPHLVFAAGDPRLAPLHGRDSTVVAPRAADILSRSGRRADLA